jgi:Rne/Rng family ribonuclease
MTKELFVSSTPHETKVALVEDEQVAELYFERENEYTLAGSIYKGRVTRVLPGMQSAFVDIGLERDAFLYVSDFFELQDEEGEIQEITVARPSEVTVFNTEQQAEAGPSSTALPAEPSVRAEGEVAEQEGARNDSESGNRGWKSRRRRRGRRGRGLPESKFERGVDGRESQEQKATPPAPEPDYQPMILPGESISKYQRMARPAQSVVPAENQENNLSAGFGSAMQEPHEEKRSRVTDETSDDEGHRSETENIAQDGGALANRLGSLSWNGEQAAAFAADHDPRSESTREGMSAAAAFAPAQSSESQPAELQAETSNPTWERERTERGYSAAHSGTLEEEEIEDEGSELPEFTEELEDESLEEMEEETRSATGTSTEHNLQHNHISNGLELTEAYEEAATEREAFQEEFVEEESESEEEGPSIEERNEADLVADAAHEEALSVLESGGEEAESRAEVRAPAATAGLQQRSPRPGWGRQRGGRRFQGRFRRRDNTQRSQPAIADLLKEGQEILVQIAKEPINKKGARITSHIALPGRFLVYMPTVNHTGVSRKIASEEERFRLKRIVLSERENGHGGFIVRTAAEGANEEELRADIRFLKHLWAEIKQRAESSKSPALIYHDLNLVERILRDQVTQDFSQIWVDTEQEYERVVRFVGRFQPGLTRRVKLYTKNTPLFEQFNLQEEINKALKSKVWLKSGGYIVINQTEALVAIDVNTGKYVGKTARLEDTIVKTNVDAIKEIVRQVRLRDLGGIIIVDFIDMDERRNRQKVMQALEEALRSDRAPSKVLQFNDFGLVAITRKRVKQSLERTLGSPCTYCTGTGFVKSVTTICNEIFTEMRKIAKQLEAPDVMLRVNPEVGKALKASNGRWLQDLEELTGRTVIVKADPTLHQEQFDIN